MVTWPNFATGPQSPARSFYIPRPAPAKLFLVPFGSHGCRAFVAQGIERPPPERKVVGSNPIEGTIRSKFQRSRQLLGSWSFELFFCLPDHGFTGGWEPLVDDDCSGCAVNEDESAVMEPRGCLHNSEDGGNTQLPGDDRRV